MISTLHKIIIYCLKCKWNPFSKIHIKPEEIINLKQEIRRGGSVFTPGGGGLWELEVVLEWRGRECCNTWRWYRRHPQLQLPVSSPRLARCVCSQTASCTQHLLLLIGHYRVLVSKLTTQLGLLQRDSAN